MKRRNRRGRLRTRSLLGAADYARWDVKRGCTSKVQHKDLAVAKRIAKHMGLSVYECPHCTWWHLSSHGGNA